MFDVLIKNYYMKKLIDYLGLFSGKNMNKRRVNIAIDWSEVISVDCIQNDCLTSEERSVLNHEKVIYIFIGENRKGEKAIDIGQTSKSLLERTMEHLQNGDYLEGYPINQKVYCGKVSAGVLVDRSLLEQIEGIMIQQLMKKSDYHLCNDSKIKTFTCSYEIDYLSNNNRQGDLCAILGPMFLVN